MGGRALLLRVGGEFRKDTLTVKVKVGDKVIVSKYAGTEVKVDGEELIIVNMGDILAIVE